MKNKPNRGSKTIGYKTVVFPCFTISLFVKKAPKIDAKLPINPNVPFSYVEIKSVSFTIKARIIV